MAQQGHALPGLAPLGEKGERRGNPQHQREEMPEFAREAPPQPLPRCRFEDIGSVFGQTAAGFGHVETVPTAAETCERRVGVEMGQFHGRGDSGQIGQ